MAGLDLSLVALARYSCFVDDSNGGTGGRVCRVLHVSSMRHFLHSQERQVKGLLEITSQRIRHTRLLISFREFIADGYRGKVAETVVKGENE